MPEPDRHDLQPTRPWSELIDASRRRGTSLRRRRRALTAAPLLGMLAGALLFTMDQPGARSPAELDVVERPPTAAPDPQPLPDLPDLGPVPSAPALLPQTEPRSRDGDRAMRPGFRSGGATQPTSVAPAVRPVAPRARGPQVVFTSDRDGAESELYVMAADGSDVRRLTANDVPEWDPAASPDGRWIAFGSADESGRGGLYRMRPDGTQRTLITSRVCVDDAVATCSFGTPTWSPDGRFIAYTDGYAYAGCEVNDDCPSIWVVGALGGSPRRLTTGWAPAWSPDGRRLAFSDYPDGENTVTCDQGTTESCDGALHIIDVASGAITDLDIRGTEPAFSPVAPLLAFTRLDPDTYYRLVLLDLRNGEEQILTDELAASDGASSPEFSRDGSRLLFVSYRQADQECSPCSDAADYDWDVFVMDLATRTEVQLTDAPRRDLGPGWLYL